MDSRTQYSSLPPGRQSLGRNQTIYPLPMINRFFLLEIWRTSREKVGPPIFAWSWPMASRENFLRLWMQKPNESFGRGLLGTVARNSTPISDGKSLAKQELRVKVVHTGYS